MNREPVKRSENGGKSINQALQIITVVLLTASLWVKQHIMCPWINKRLLKHSQVLSFSLSFKIRQEELDEKWFFFFSNFFFWWLKSMSGHIFRPSEYHNFLWAKQCFFSCLWPAISKGLELFLYRGHSWTTFYTFHSPFLPRHMLEYQINRLKEPI